MKIFKLLENDETEFFSEEDVDEVVSAIKQNCGPWLKSYGWDNVILYRSRQGYNAKTYDIYPIRTDRQPKSTHPSVQNIIVDLFIEEAERQGVRDPEGVANRNNSAFCYVGDGDWFYGKPHVFFPVGDFRTTYVEGVTDLFAVLPVEFKSDYAQMAFGDNEVADAYRRQYELSAEEAKEIVMKGAKVMYNRIKGKVVYDSLKNFFGGHGESRSDEIMVKAPKGLYVNPVLMDLVLEKVR